MNRYAIFLGLFFCLLALLLMQGCTEEKRVVPEYEKIGLELDINLLKEELDRVKLENTKLQGQVNTLNLKNNQLQEVYNSLNLNFQYCFFSNYCLYYPSSCENYFNNKIKVEELHKNYSNLCVLAYNDWNKYVSFDTSIKNN